MEDGDFQADLEEDNEASDPVEPRHLQSDLWLVNKDNENDSESNESRDRTSEASDLSCTVVGEIRPILEEEVDFTEETTRVSYGTSGDNMNNADDALTNQGVQTTVRTNNIEDIVVEDNRDTPHRIEATSGEPSINQADKYDKNAAVDIDQFEATDDSLLKITENTKKNLDRTAPQSSEIIDHAETVIENREEHVNNIENTGTCLKDSREPTSNDPQDSITVCENYFEDESSSNSHAFSNGDLKIVHDELDT